MSIRDWFSKEVEEESLADRLYDTLFQTVKELDKQGLNRLLSGIEAMWSGYDTLRRIKTRNEKEDAKEAKADQDISDTENGNFLELEQKP